MTKLTKIASRWSILVQFSPLFFFCPSPLMLMLPRGLILHRALAFKLRLLLASVKCLYWGKYENNA